MVGLSPSPTAGSFIRPNRNTDTPQSFKQALRQKYTLSNGPDNAIHISGKTVEEVGFEKIQRQLQNLRELRTIILDRRCISFIGPGRSLPQQQGEIQDLRLGVRELDLSYNLLETWSGVLSICALMQYTTNLDVAYVSPQLFS